MAEPKKVNKSKAPKDVNELFMETHFEKNIPKTKRIPKRQKTDNADEDISNLMGMYQAHTKKKKLDNTFDAKDSRQKLLDVLGQQMDARKNVNSMFSKRLTDVMTQLEADYEVMKENEQKLEHLTGVFLKCIKQSSAAQKQNVKALKDIHGSFKKEVEGLLTRGAMKPDDRPLWFDVYRAFPPATEPKFARPKPENKPIRQIFYKEDVIRAQFHSQGYGFGAVNMLSPAADTQTKRLLKQYEKLKSEGVPESELIEKSVAAVGLQQEARKQETPKVTPQNPDSVTAQVLKEADIKNIFKES